MGMRAEARLCYGVILEEQVFPWSEREDIDDWWIYDICHFQHSFQLYDEKGDYLDGKKPSPDRMRQYWEEKIEFSRQHSLPIRLVNYAHYDESCYILTLPEVYMKAEWGNPTSINLDTLTVTKEQEQLLYDFLADHHLAFKGQPQWYLSAYWG